MIIYIILSVAFANESWVSFFLIMCIWLRGYEF